MTTFLALLTGGGLAVLGGLLSGWLNNRLGEKRDQRKYEHERAMALETRRQQRLEQAYLELLGYLSYHAEWARSVGAVQGPDPLPREDIRRIQALIEAYGSPKVRGLLQVWRECVADLALAGVTSGTVEESPDPSQELDDDARDELGRIPSYRRAIFQTAEAIREQVRRELAGEA
jgi:hypothetical protein